MFCILDISCTTYIINYSVEFNLNAYDPYFSFLLLLEYIFSISYVLFNTVCSLLIMKKNEYLLPFFRVSGTKEATGDSCGAPKLA